MSPRLSELFLSSQSDERLVALARAGHERAFAAIVERYGPELQALARRLCADGRGEDVVQQTFLSAFAALRDGAEVKHLRGWLYRIVRNAAFRSRAPQYAPLDSATLSSETVEDVVQQRALAMSALTELSRLPARQRQAMVGTVGGMARSEVASTMGLSEGAVRQLVHRARSTLRTGVTAVTPWPLTQWIASGPSGGGSPVEVVAGAAAGAASTGGFLGVKLGIVLASGVIATGVAAVDIHGLRHPAPSRPTARAGAHAGHPQSARHGVRAVETAAVAPAAVSPAGMTPAVVSRVVLRPAVPRSAAAIYVAASSRSRQASHGVPVRRPKAPAGADAHTGERPQPPDGGGTDGGRTHTDAVGGGGRHTSVGEGAAPGLGDGSRTSGEGGSGRPDGGGDPSAGRSDGSGSGTGQGVDGITPEAYGARSSGTASDVASTSDVGSTTNAGGVGDGGARWDGSGPAAGGSAAGGGGGGAGSSGASGGIVGGGAGTLGGGAGTVGGGGGTVGAGSLRGN